MNRIAVLGAPGSGKTTFCLRLGEATGLPVVHLDQLFWRPGWTTSPIAEYEAAHDDAVAAGRWIIDGVYSGHFGDRLKRADIIVLFVMPTSLTMFRVARRVAMMHGRTRPDMGEDCPERWSWEFMRWAFRWRRTRLPVIRACIAEQASDAEVIEITSRRGSEALLHRLCSTQSDPGRLGSLPA